MPKPTPFFATPNDLYYWLRSILTVRELVATEAGIFDSPEQNSVLMSGGCQIGISMTGNQITDPTFLIHDISTFIVLREVPQQSGAVRYSVDQRLNPNTLGLKMGGMFGDGIVIAGQLGVGTGEPVSNELADLLGKEMRRKFSKIKSYYVGREASSMLDAGARLTINSAASIEYDLTR